MGDFQFDPAPPGLGGTPPYFPFLIRQPDCSLTQTVIDKTAAIQLQNANYQDTLHQKLQVPTTADKFLNGCQDPSTGIKTPEVSGPNGAGGVVAVAADFNGDGKKDIATSYAVSIQTQLNNPAHPQFIDAIATGDMNGNDKPDMVFAWDSSAINPTLSVALGKGDGTFQAQKVVGTPTFSLTVNLSTVTVSAGSPELRL